MSKSVVNFFKNPYTGGGGKRIPVYYNRKFSLLKDEGKKIFILLYGSQKPIWVLKSSIKWEFDKYL